MEDPLFRPDNIQFRGLSPYAVSAAKKIAGPVNWDVKRYYPPGRISTIIVEHHSYVAFLASKIDRDYSVTQKGEGGSDE